MNSQKNDLTEFKQAILPIMEFHKLKYPEHRKIVDSTDHMFRRIDYRLNYVAKDVEESKVSFRVQQIKNSFDTDMPPRQIKDEFAKIIDDDLREIIQEKDKSKKAKKKKNKDSSK